MINFFLVRILKKISLQVMKEFTYLQNGCLQHLQKLSSLATRLGRVSSAIETFRTKSQESLAADSTFIQVNYLPTGNVGNPINFTFFCYLVAVVIPVPRCLLAKGLWSVDGGQGAVGAAHHSWRARCHRRLDPPDRKIYFRCFWDPSKRFTFILSQLLCWFDRQNLGIKRADEWTVVKSGGTSRGALDERRHTENYGQGIFKWYNCQKNVV